MMQQHQLTMISRQPQQTQKPMMQQIQKEDAGCGRWQQKQQTQQRKKDFPFLDVTADLLMQHYMQWMMIIQSM